MRTKIVSLDEVRKDRNLTLSPGKYVKGELYCLRCGCKLSDVSETATADDFEDDELLCDECYVKMVERIDEVESVVFECMKVLVQEDVEWDAEVVSTITETMKMALELIGFSVEYPSIVTDERGRRYYME